MYTVTWGGFKVGVKNGVKSIKESVNAIKL
jgi:hypothetical protein